MHGDTRVWAAVILLSRSCQSHLSRGGHIIQQPGWGLRRLVPNPIPIVRESCPTVTLTPSFAAKGQGASGERQKKTGTGDAPLTTPPSQPSVPPPTCRSRPARRESILGTDDAPYVRIEIMYHDKHSIAGGVTWDCR